MRERLAYKAEVKFGDALHMLSRTRPAAVLTTKVLLQQAHAVHLMACRPEVHMLQHLGADVQATPQATENPGDVSFGQEPRC